jgi:hypothetical protein
MPDLNWGTNLLNDVRCFHVATGVRIPQAEPPVIYITICFDYIVGSVESSNLDVMLSSAPHEATVSV